MDDLESFELTGGDGIDGPVEPIAEDVIELDLDGDGLADATGELLDIDGDGVADAIGVDIDGDGTFDGIISGEEVVDQQILLDETVLMEVTESVELDLEVSETVLEETGNSDLNGEGESQNLGFAQDLNGDGIPDMISYDIDGDGVPDTMTLDFDGDGIPDRFTDMNGLPFAGKGLAGVYGTPQEDMEHWHQQTYNDTCAVASQEFVLESLTGEEFSEDHLRMEAIEHGWYTPGGGTPMEYVGDLLELHGLETAKCPDASIDDMKFELSHGRKVIIGLDSDELWNQPDLEDTLENFTGLPGQDANHAVQVIGIDDTDPNNVQVTLNDPGHPEGGGMTVPAEQFVDAWEDSGCFMVSAWKA